MGFGRKFLQPYDGVINFLIGRQKILRNFGPAKIIENFFLCTDYWSVCVLATIIIKLIFSLIFLAVSEKLDSNIWMDVYPFEVQNPKNQ